MSPSGHEPITCRLSFAGEVSFRKRGQRSSSLRGGSRNGAERANGKPLGSYPRDSRFNSDLRYLIFWCSREVALTLNERLYLSDPKKCLRCDRKIPYGKRYNKFCGHSCCCTFWNLRRGDFRRGITVKCKWCNNKIKRGSQATCSRSCHMAYLWARKVKEIERTGVAKPIKKAKRYISEKCGVRCEICGIPGEWRGSKLVLSLDHKNGNGEDWRLGNLRLLCPNCHSQTDTYCGRNMGKGRVARRERERFDYRRKKHWL